MSISFTSSGLADDSSSSALFLDNVLRGIGQVMLQNNSYAGLLFLLGISLNSGLQALGVLAGAAISTLTAYGLGVNKADIRAGLHGFNGALVGLAVLIFLAPSSLTWLTLLLAATFSTLLTLALNRLLSAWQIPAFTAPFVLVSWCLFLSNARFGRLESTQLLPTAGLPSSTVVEGVVTWQSLLEGTLNGIGQVFFQGSVSTGLVFLLALVISSRPSALLAIFGSLAGALVAWLWGAAEPAIHIGAFGFNGVLVGIALAVFWPSFSKREWVLAVIALLITPFVYAALSAALEMPALTLAFVLVTWVVLLANCPSNLAADKT